jgi:Zn finger protein HypA/HybF involved in hydrogenase expression
VGGISEKERFKQMIDIYRDAHHRLHIDITIGRAKPDKEEYGFAMKLQREMDKFRLPEESPSAVQGVEDSPAYTYCRECGLPFDITPKRKHFCCPACASKHNGRQHRRSKLN